MVSNVVFTSSQPLQLSQLFCFAGSFIIDILGNGDESHTHTHTHTQSLFIKMLGKEGDAVVDDLNDGNSNDNDYPEKKCSGE